ncbi:MAG: polysaccharide deacetylase family protein [Bacteroidota bacterium]|nr:polysaccharide deacetylase family protein [Bacteroidota bacterium]
MVMWLLTNPLVANLFPSYLWFYPRFGNSIYLSFDDGPTPYCQEFILNTLAEYKAVATFFLVGENIVKYPNLYKQLLNTNNRIANHSQHHLKGWKTDLEAYVNDVKECESHISNPYKLFRPPYGKITKAQAKHLKADGYKIVMWSFLTYDFAKEIDHNYIISQFKRKVKAGDIIVFHDNIKSKENLEILLPAFLNIIKELNLKTVVIS